MGAEKMSEAKYWIWLSMALGAGARTDEVLSAYTSPENIYNESRRERIISGVFTKAKLDRMEKVHLSEAEKAVELCNKNGWKIYTPDDESYPEKLRNLTDMPLVLFCDGDLSCIDGKVTIGVVGTRNPSFESVKIARKLSFDMAQKGAIIVSGGAQGIDSASHEGALTAGVPTVCVLGCGLGTRYLMSNATMRSEIAKNGAVITEYPPFAEASKTTFPLRNRIISGLSNGVLVVEAGERSGSLITAGCAINQGRDVFAVPGSILSTAYTGANKLIKDGAKAVTCAEDILEIYEGLYPKAFENQKSEAIESLNKKPNQRIVPHDIEGDALVVYKLLSENPLHSDEICAISGLNSPRTMAALTELEIMGYASQTEGKNYVLS
jgi:DNA processing protein